MAFLKQTSQQLASLSDGDGPFSKKTLFIGGGLLLAAIIVLVLVLTSGGSKSGQTEMNATLEPLSESVGIVSTYESDLSRSDVKNDMTLAKLLLTSSYRSLNELYETTFTPAKKFPLNPKPDQASVEILDAAVKANSVDSEIINVLEPKVEQALSELEKARPSFSKESSVNTIETAKKSLTSVLDILNRAR